MDNDTLGRENNASNMPGKNFNTNEIGRWEIDQNLKEGKGAGHGPKQPREVAVVRVEANLVCCDSVVKSLERI